MPNLSEMETRWLGEISKETLWKHAQTLAQWEKVSGTPDELKAVDYLQQCLVEYGLKPVRYELDSLLGWPEDAQLEVRSPQARSIKCITHSFTPSTAPEGLEGEVLYLGLGKESDFQSKPVAGKIVLMEGMPSPARVLLGSKFGVAAEIFINDRLRDMCVSPVWGTPTTKTADLLPKMPVISIVRSDAVDLKALVEKGPVKVWLRTKTFWGWRKVPLLVGNIPGAVEPDKFVLLSGHHCSWYYGAMDNGTANATILEVARVLSSHRKELRRSLRVAFWPGHTQGRYSGSTWYVDQFFEDLYDNCVLHVNVDGTGAKGAVYYGAICMPEAQEFALANIHDSIGKEAEPERMARAGDQSFWGCGFPAIYMGLSEVPLDQAVDMGGVSLFQAAGQGAKKSGSPWWWHTPDDTIDKIDPEVLKIDTRVYLLAVSRGTNLPILPFKYSVTATLIREALEKYKAGAGDLLDLGAVVDRAKKLEAATRELDKLLGQAKAQSKDGKLADIANKGLMALGRSMLLVSFSAAAPFDQDLAVPIPLVPLLEPALKLKGMDPKAGETRFLATELTRNRNKVAFYLREALETAEKTAAALK